MTHLPNHHHLPTTHEPTAHGFYFYGTGLEYFKIWIVNLVLTVITLGFYSPWAKVRRLRYFYGNTVIDEASFDFTANPKRILLGRLIALAIYGIISIGANFSPELAMLGSTIIVIVMPWLMRSSMRFMARNSQYNNIRFGFDGSLGGAYGVMILSSILSVISFGLLAPVSWWLFKRYQFDNTYFGDLKFEFNTSIWDMYKAIIIPLLVLVGSFFGLGSFLMSLGFLSSDANPVNTSLIVIALFAFYVIFLLTVPLMQAYIHKAIWEKLTLGDNEFMLYDFSPLKFAVIQLTNYIGIICTLGLFYPWAKVRMHRYKTETLALVAYDDFELLSTPESHEESALAEEISDVFDFDISW